MQRYTPFFKLTKIFTTFFDKWWNNGPKSCSFELFFVLLQKYLYKMKVAIVQHDIEWAQPQHNLQRLSHLLGQQPGADLYVLAETFATGFLPSTDGAPAAGAAALIWMQEQAARLNAAIAGSAAATDAAGQLRNRLFFVRPDGNYDFYDKHHLFGYAGETDAYVAGNRRVVTEWRGVRFLLQVCYDLRFPVFSRNRADYDAALYVANWPQSRMDVWQTLLKARALENQCFVVGVNRVGSDPACHYSGGSTIVDAYGHELCRCTDDAEQVAVADFDMERLHHFRQKFPVLKDRDRT